MKYLSIIIFFSSHLSNKAFSQIVTGVDSLKAYYLLPVENVITLSKSEMTAKKPGYVSRMQKDYMGYIQMSGVQLITEAVKATALPQNLSYKWLTFSFSESAFFAKKKISASFDAEELDEMISALKIIKDSIFIRNPHNYIEYTFKSRMENIAIGAYTDGTDINDRWQCYIKLNELQLGNYYYYPKITFSRGGLSLLLDYLEKAKKFLDDK
jgi:hypothetical protein